MADTELDAITQPIIPQGGNKSSLDQTLEDAWDVTEATRLEEQGKERAVKEEISKEVQPSEAEGKETPPSEAQRGRDDKGRFAKKPGEVAPPPTEAQPDLGPLPPRSWNADDRKVWDQLPTSAKQTVLRREQEVQQFLSQKTQEMSAFVREHQGMDEAVAPYRQTFALAGLNPGQAIARLAEWHEWLSNDPDSALVALAARYNRTWEQLANVPVEEQIDPRYDELEQRFAETQEQLRNQQQAFLQAQLSSLQQEVDTFSGAKDQEGQVMYPLMAEEQFKADMTPVVKMLRDSHPDWQNYQILHAAYNATVHAYPQYADYAKRMAERLAVESRSDLAAKRNAASSVRGAPIGTSATSAPPDTKDLGKLLEYAYDSANSP